MYKCSCGDACSTRVCALSALQKQGSNCTVAEHGPPPRLKVSFFESTSTLSVASSRPARKLGTGDGSHVATRNNHQQQTRSNNSPKPPTTTAHQQPTPHTTTSARQGGEQAAGSATSQGKAAGAKQGGSSCFTASLCFARHSRACRGRGDMDASDEPTPPFPTSE